jgi:hypothetical protein
LAICQTISPEAPSEEATAIYRAFLSSYHVDSSWGARRIGKLTTPFSPNAAPESADECLKSLDIPVPMDAHLHALTASSIPGSIKSVIVDPLLEDKKIVAKESSPQQPRRKHARPDMQAHILSLSEVVFNADHTRAVMSYSFVCGMLCGDGGGALFEKRDGKWIFVKNVCGHWVS